MILILFDKLIEPATTQYIEVADGVSQVFLRRRFYLAALFPARALRIVLSLITWLALCPEVGIAEKSLNIYCKMGVDVEVVKPGDGK